MRKTACTEEQIAHALREAESGTPVQLRARTSRARSQRRELFDGALIPGWGPLGDPAFGLIDGLLDLATIAMMPRVHTVAARWPSRVSRSHLERGVLLRGWHAPQVADGHLGGSV